MSKKVFIALTHCLRQDCKGNLPVVNISLSCKNSFTEKIKIIDHTKLNNIDIDKEVNEIINYFNIVLNDLSKQLSKIHNRNYLINYLRILIGYWLINFIYSTYIQF